VKRREFIRSPGAIHYGLLENDHVVDLVPLLGNEIPDLKPLIAVDGVERARQAADDSSARIPLAEIQLAPVIPNPGKILCIGLNYESHRKETGRAKTEYPAVFTRFADTQNGKSRLRSRRQLSKFRCPGIPHRDQMLDERAG
jgi:2-keto-4-pentenoate hydratase/2-oxohepta-3-ene-1,7-dioic acid hydratase in catechol pathway